MNETGTRFLSRMHLSVGRSVTLLEYTCADFALVLPFHRTRPLFLVADTQLYKRLCPSVGRSVGWLVRRCDRVKKCENAHIRPCPPVRNWWPCIQPSFSFFFFLFVFLSFFLSLHFSSLFSASIFLCLFLSLLISFPVLLFLSVFVSFILVFFLSLFLSFLFGQWPRRRR